MHDCRKMKEDLIDLVFNEVEAERELRILEEMEACRDCRAEYRSMNEALQNFDCAAPALVPTGEFWDAYHASLEKRVDAAGAHEKKVVPFWRRTFQTSFSIPVPVAIAASLLFAVTSVMAIRSFMIEPKLQPKASTPAAQVRFVEVPVEKRVVEEKIVTRTVYVTRRAAGAGAGRSNQPPPSPQDLQGMTAQKSKDDTGNAVRPTLNGFQPPQDVRLTVIKGSFKDEK